MADDQDTISEDVRKTPEDYKSTSRVSRNDQGHSISKLDEYDTGADLPSLAKELRDKRFVYTSVPIDEDEEPMESSGTIFTPKEVNDDEQNNSPSTGLSQRFTPTTAENAHNDPNSFTGSTHCERLFDTTRLEIDVLRQEEVNAQRGLDDTKTHIKELRAYLEADRGLLVEIEAHMEQNQASLEAHQARLGPEQARLADIQARLALGYARLYVANNMESDMS